MIYTSESVTPKHPDKVCDQISDMILDYCLTYDPLSRVAIETLGGHSEINLCGEVTTNAYLSTDLVKHNIEQNFAYIRNFKIRTNIVKQSNDIAKGVDTGGAGDQGIMIGYACNENEEMIPNEYYLARKLAKSLYEKYPFDGKTQVTVDSIGNIQTVVASFQYVKQKELLDSVKKVIPNAQKYFVNPAGDWECGGFDADTGVTGRKIAIDNYGTRIPIGGGAFSGKDGTKVDRSGAYMARRIATDYLKQKGANEVLVKLAYAIGEKIPVMAVALIDGVEEKVNGYDLSPQGIIDLLELRKPIFKRTAEWGAMGNNFLWR